MTDSNPYQSPASAYEDPQSVGADGRHREPSGLGGWLILPAIGMALSPFRLAAHILQIYVPLFQDGTWELLTTPGSEHYHGLWAPLLIFELAANVGFILAYVALLFLFFRKSRIFPKTYITVAILNIFFAVFDPWLASFVLPPDQPMFDPATTKEIVRSIGAAAIWMPYMMLSKRVKNTFVQ